MNFETYLNQGWDDHATKPEQVLKSFSSALPLIENDEHISQLAHLVTHVCGQHLGRWSDGIGLLNDLKTNARFVKNGETEKAVNRSILSLQLASGAKVNLENLSLSEQIRVQALAASSLSEHEPIKASEFLSQAIELSTQGVEKQDPANRSLAVSGNNIASALLEKKNRAPQETEFMIKAAKVGREFWELAGGPIQVSRAEYLLAKVYADAKMFPQGLDHAKQCVRICEDNQLSKMDLYFSYEALVTAEKNNSSLVNEAVALEKAKFYFAHLPPEDIKWCESSMNNLLNAK